MSIISDLNLFWSVSGNMNAAGGWGNLSIESGMSAENTVDMDEWKEWDTILTQFMLTPSSLILRTSSLSWNLILRLFHWALDRLMFRMWDQGYSLVLVRVYLLKRLLTNP